jgi:SAM-dependent methyltransferase
MVKARMATEKLALDQARTYLAQDRKTAAAWMKRLSSAFEIPPNARVLDVGAAQGRTVIALQELGYRSFGVEPMPQARDIAQQLAIEAGVNPEVIVGGSAEDLPFEDASFDVVLSCSVLEHVIDPEPAVAEACRVLAPGGVFWFDSTTALCPRQEEIRGFPAFGWYPNRLKIRIMHWAARERPHLVGHTDTPAIHWYTPWKARRMLTGAGLCDVHDYWDLRLPEEGGALHRVLLGAIRSNKAGKLLAEILTGKSAYAARKPMPGRLKAEN